MSETHRPLSLPSSPRQVSDQAVDHVDVSGVSVAGATLLDTTTREERTVRHFLTAAIALLVGAALLTNTFGATDLAAAGLGAVANWVGALFTEILLGALTD